MLLTSLKDVEYLNAEYAKNKLKRIVELLLGQNIWVIFRAWETIENFKTQLESCGLGSFSHTLTLANRKDGLVDYKLFNPLHVFYAPIGSQDGFIEVDTVSKIAHGIIHNDIGLEPYLNAGAYFINVSHMPYLLNVPDDRAVELVFRKQDEKYFKTKMSHNSYSLI